MSDATERVVIELSVDDLSKFLSDFRKADQAVDNFHDSAQEKSGKLSTFVSRTLAHAFANILVGAIRAAGDAIVAFGRKAMEATGQAIEAAEEFETAIVKLSNVADEGSSLKELSEVSLRLGEDTNLIGVGAADAAEGLEILYKGGLATNAILGPNGLESTLAGNVREFGAFKAAADLAAISELEFSDAASVGVVTLTTFGKAIDNADEQAKFVTRTFDTIAKTANTTNGEIKGLSEAFAIASPTLSELGFTADETIYALGLMADAGIKGTTAGTQLRRMVANLNRDTVKVTESHALHGTSLFDLSGNLRTLEDVMDSYAKATANMTQEEKARLIQTDAGVHGQNALSILMARTTDLRIEEAKAAGDMELANRLLAESVDGTASAFENLRTKQEHALDTSEQVTAILTTNAAKIEIVESQLQTLQIKFGNVFIGVKKQMLEALIPLLDKWLPLFTEALDEGALKIEALATEYIPQLVKWMDEKLIPALLRFTEWLFEDGIPLMIRFTKSFVKFVEDVAPFVKFLWELSKTMNILFIAPIIYATKVVKWLANALNIDLGNSVKGASSFIEVLTGWLRTFNNSMISGDGVINSVYATGDAIADTTSKALTFVDTGIRNMLDGLDRTKWHMMSVTDVNNKLKDSIKGVTDFINTNWQNAMNAIDRGLQPVRNAISSLTSFVSNLLSKLYSITSFKLPSFSSLTSGFGQSSVQDSRYNTSNTTVNNITNNNQRSSTLNAQTSSSAAQLVSRFTGLNFGGI